MGWGVEKDVKRVSIGQCGMNSVLLLVSVASWIPAAMTTTSLAMAPIARSAINQYF